MSITPIKIENFFYSKDKASNKVRKYYSDTSRGDCIFVPNWRALPHHWECFCKELAKCYHVYYFETREKESFSGGTSRINLTSEAMAADVIKFINQMGFKDYKLILCSFAVPLIVEHWDKIEKKPQSAVLICPMNEVNLPKAVRLFARIPVVMLPLLAHIFYKIVKNIPAFKSICKNLSSAIENCNINEIYKIHGSVRSILKMKIALHQFSIIDSPVLIIKTKQDPIHNPGIGHELNQMLGYSWLYEVENFKKAHSIDAAQIILKHDFFTENKDILMPAV